MAGLCEVEQVCRIYGTPAVPVHALRDVSLSVDAGEFTVITGPSGSGKSTLLNLLGCLDRPTSGRVRIDGVDVSTLDNRALARLRGARIGFVFQRFNLVPVLTAVENVALALTLARDGEDATERASEALTQVGLGSMLHRRPGELSGGQQQRVAVARALVKAPAVVIADEPTANLDRATSESMIDLMRALNEERGVTFLFSTHDPRLVGRARRVLTLEDGRVVDDAGPPPT